MHAPVLVNRIMTGGTRHRACKIDDKGFVVKVNSLLFNNELHLLLARLIYEYDLYDKFYVFEATRLFSGAPKPLYLEAYLKDIPDPLAKIEYRVVGNLPDPIQGSFLGTLDRPLTENRWEVEQSFRDAMTAHLRELPGDAIIYFQDIDEIASRESVLQAEDFIRSGKTDIYRFKYHWFKNGILKTDFLPQVWKVGFAASCKYLTESALSPHMLRIAHRRPDGKTWISWKAISPASCKLGDGSQIYEDIDLSHTRNHYQEDDVPYGWHLSSMHGRDAKLRTLKHNSFSHAEYSVKTSPEEPVIDPIEHIKTVAQAKRIDTSMLCQQSPAFVVNSELLRFFS